METNPTDKTEELAEVAEETEGQGAAEAVELTDDHPSAAKKRRHSIARIGIVAAIVVVVISVVTIGLVFTIPQTASIPDAQVPLSSYPASSGTASSGSALSGTNSGNPTNSGSVSTDSKDEENSTPAGQSNNTGTTPSNNSGNNGGGATNGGSSDSGGQTWVPGWDEQVWVDTSHYESVYVGENPIMETHSICNECGAIISGFAAQHLLDTGHFGYRSDLIQVGSTPVYEDQWVTSGYWTTVHHDGYWK